MIKSGHVATDRADRYTKQVVSHMGRKLSTENLADGQRLIFVDRDGDGHRIGHVDLRPTDSSLDLVAEADDAATADRIAAVVWRHLDRFGERDGLSIDWD